MNYLLTIQKKYLLFFIFTIVLISLTVLVYKTVKITSLQNEMITIRNSKSDITNPKFTINSEDEKISISANQGDFLTKDEILLRKDVIFQSNKFTIYSDDVIFNKDKQTAESKQKSKFISNNTSILSDGFEIVDEGNKIKFNGKTILKLK